ncbi:hypothetical protein KSP35_16305 [Aquihabitans sp. G128]|nr:hypothetical protein [Aquihabitans sp. G128]QXC59926.1 hypothetical protein KSP35_16305 [Aquihabitans sp. G128]
MNTSLENDCTSNASEYVIFPSGANRKSLRTPPGFISAICAPPRPVSFVPASCTSAMKFAPTDSVARFGSRLMSAVIDPITSWPNVAALVLAVATICATAALGWWPTTSISSAEEPVTALVAVSTVRVARPSFSP